MTTDEAVAAWRRLVLLALVVLSVVRFTAAQSSDDFSIVVLPDPQNYSQYYPQIFQQQTQWIADHRAERNIQLVVGVGDMVNHWDSATEWQNADAAIKTLDGAQVPYLLAIGNHDYDNFNPKTRGAAAFNTWFGPARYATSPVYRGNYNGSNENFYATLTAGGTQYLLLVLEFYPRDAVLAWAESVLAQYPAAPVIVVTHSFMYVDDTRVDECDTNDMSVPDGNDPDRVWRSFVSQYENIFLVLSGHVSRKPQSKRLDAGKNGRLVMQTLQDWQDAANGGDGWLRIYTFHPATNTVDVQTYSPYRESLGQTAWLTDAENRFSFPMSAYAAQSGQGTIAGRVRYARAGTSKDCLGAEGATVSAGGVQATTDASGRYALAVPAPAVDSVQASLTGATVNGRDSFAWPGLSDQVELFAVPDQTTSGSCTIDFNGVRMCTPTNGSTVASPVSVTAAARSTVPIKFMQIYLDGAAQKTVSGAELNEQLAVADGTHRLTVQAKDTSGLITKVSASITVSTPPPGADDPDPQPPPPPPPPPPTCTAPASGVAICAPAQGATPASPVRVWAAAASTAPIKFVQVYVDGKAVLTVNGATLDAQVPMAAGARRVTVQAKDVNGVIVKSTVNVTVQ
ncbi:MAG TPA: Ig-like domain-containing protein [Terriglobales bacterium]|nr:Ig-like domain-containing protein [Terriglobales bacterium]